MNKVFGPGYRAASYEAVVPDTLDLSERAELALHGIARTIDPANDYMTWFGAYWCSRPPFLLHIGADEECAPKFLDALTQLRLASGSEEFLDVEQGLVQTLLNCVEEGLYTSRYDPHRPWRNAAYQPCPPRAEDYFIRGSTGMMMVAMILRNDMGITPCADLIQDMARGLDRVSIDKEDYAYFPLHDGTGHPFSYSRSALFKGGEEASYERQSAEGSVVAYFGYPLRGLAMWAERAGDEQALELAGKFARFVMQPRFWGHPSDPPHVAGRELGHVDSHVHARAIALRGLLEYGLAAGDRRACDFVRFAYEYLRSYGLAEIGHIPCWVDRNVNDMEGCLLGDLVALTLKMSDAGLGDYWEDADRIIRNHLVEAQLTNRDLIARVLELRFPLRDQTVTRTANVGKSDAETAYSFDLHGNTVLRISPRDESPQNYTFYQHDHLRGGQAPMKKVRRSVISQTARW